MITGKRRIAFIRQFQVAMNDALAAHCFRVDGSPRRWLRKWGWKSDVVIFTRGGYDVFVNFCIYVPTPAAVRSDEEMRQMSTNGLGLLLGSNNSGIRYPSSLFPVSRSVKKMAAQLEIGIERFNQLNTPERCLDHLKRQSGPMGNGARPGSPVYRAAEEYLTSIEPIVVFPACTLNQFKSSPSEIFRRLFVP